MVEHQANLWICKSLIYANNVLFSWHNRFSKWTTNRRGISRHWNIVHTDKRQNIVEVFTKIQCVKFIVPFMLVVPLFSPYSFCVRVMLLCVCVLVFFLSSSSLGLAFILCYCWCLFICLPLLLFVALQRIIWHMAFRLSFCSVLFCFVPRSVLYTGGKCVRQWKNQVKPLGAHNNNNNKQHPKLEQEHLAR